MHLLPIQTKIIDQEDTLEEIIPYYIKDKMEEGDVLVISSKIVSVMEKRIVILDSITPSKEAKEYAKKTNLSPEFCQLVINEADAIYNFVPGGILTQKNNILIANAGIDQSNSKTGTAILWPENPQKSVEHIYKIIQEELKLNNFGVILNDSRCIPLRKGTVGFALAAHGFLAVENEVGKEDLFGKKMRVTTRAIADMLSSAANALMGDTNNSCPLVIIKNSNVSFSLKKQEKEMLIDEKADLFGPY